MGTAYQVIMKFPIKWWKLLAVLMILCGSLAVGTGKATRGVSITGTQARIYGIGLIGMGIYLLVSCQKYKPK
ncbi:MAG: hypothetical protein PHD76_13150 [Methylacidiphilales bacterium]|nr:hypothetical protein [Candidatus Methylacidiphilales bacterium]